MRQVKIVAISGKQGSGKSTLADGLCRRAEQLGYTVYRTRFAKVLYEMHDAIKQVCTRYDIPTKDKEGELLQLLGTEWGRNVKGQDVWVNALRAGVENAVEIKKALTYGTGRVLVVIDDMRFKNEFHLFDQPFKFEDGVETACYRLRLEASRSTRKARCHGWRETDQHPSETDLDQYVRLDFDTQMFDNVFDSNVVDAESVLNEAVRTLELT